MNDDSLFQADQYVPDNHNRDQSPAFNKNPQRSNSSNAPNDWLQKQLQNRNSYIPDNNNAQDSQTQAVSYSNAAASPDKNTEYKKNMVPSTNLKSLFQAPSKSTNIFDRSNHKRKQSQIKNETTANDETNTQQTNGNQQRVNKLQNTADEQNLQSERGSSQYKYKNVFSKENRSKSRQGSVKNSIYSDAVSPKCSPRNDPQLVRKEVEIVADSSGYGLKNFNKDKSKSAKRVLNPNSINNDVSVQDTQQSFNIQVINKSPPKNSYNQTPSFSENKLQIQQFNESRDKPRKSARRIDPSELFEETNMQSQNQIQQKQQIIAFPIEKEMPRKSARKLNPGDIDEDLVIPPLNEEPLMKKYIDEILITSLEKSQHSPDKHIEEQTTGFTQENEVNSLQFDKLVRQKKVEQNTNQKQQKIEDLTNHYQQQDEQQNEQFNQQQNLVENNNSKADYISQDNTSHYKQLEQVSKQSSEITPTPGQQNQYQQQQYRDYMQQDLPEIKEEEERSYTISPAQYNKTDVSNVLSYNAFQQYPFKITEMGYGARSSDSTFTTPFGNQDQADQSLNLMNDTFLKTDRPLQRQDTSSPDGKFMTSLLFNELFQSNNHSSNQNPQHTNNAAAFQVDNPQPIKSDDELNIELQEELLKKQQKVEVIVSKNSPKQGTTIVPPVRMKDQLEQELKEWKAQRATSPIYPPRDTSKKGSPIQISKQNISNISDKQQQQDQIHLIDEQKEVDQSILDEQQKEIIKIYFDEDFLQNQLKLQLVTIFDDINKENQAIKTITQNIIDNIIGDDVMNLITQTYQEEKQAQAEAQLYQRRTELMRLTKRDDNYDTYSDNTNRNYQPRETQQSPNQVQDKVIIKSPFQTREKSEKQRQFRDAYTKDESKGSVEQDPPHSAQKQLLNQYQDNQDNLTPSGKKQVAYQQQSAGLSSNQTSFLNPVGDKSYASALQEAPAFNILSKKNGTEQQPYLSKQYSENVQHKHQPKNSFQMPHNYYSANMNNISNDNEEGARQSEISDFKLRLTIDNMKSNIEDEDADVVISSDEDDSVQRTGVNQTKVSKGMKSVNAVQKYGVRNFNHHFNSEKLGQDESPFIHLSINPKYIDVLCVTCYECVKFQDVDKHSLSCMALKNINDKQIPSDPLNFNFEQNIKNLVRKDRANTSSEVSKDQDDDFNERIFKLKKSIKARLVEIQHEDSSSILIDHYSNLHAIALKIFENNQDPNSLLIMAKIIEEFIQEIQQIQKKSSGSNERLISLFVFSRRLILLNNEKYQQLAKFNMKSNNMQESFGSGSEWDKFDPRNNNSSERLHTNTELKKRRPYHVINDIKSEIESERYPDNQSDYSDVSSVSNNIFSTSSAQNRFASFKNNKQLSGSEFKYSPHSTHSQNFSTKQKITVTYSNNANDHSHSPALNIPRTASPMSSNAQTMFSPNLRDQRTTSTSKRGQKQESDSDMRRYFYSLVIIKLNYIGGKMPKDVTFASLYNLALVSNCLK